VYTKHVILICSVSANHDEIGPLTFIMKAVLKDPLDATLSSNLSLCWSRLGEAKLALLEAQQCKTKRPDWWKAWCREGAALSSLKVQKLCEI